MDIQDFQILEGKIGSVLDKLETLKQENTELNRKLEQLQVAYNEKASALETITVRLQKAESNVRDVEKEEKIRSKVSGLLDKLENF